MTQDFRIKRPPYGFPFLDVETTAFLEKKARLAQEILQKAGFARIMPPTVDFSETFSVYGGYPSFVLRDSLGENLSLRSDVTAQVMKALGNLFLKEKYPTKIYYTVPIFRDIRKSYPSLREIWQVGAEIIGQDPKESIFELLALAVQIIEQVFSVEYTVLLGDIRACLVLEDALQEKDLRQILLWRNAPRFAELLKNKWNIQADLAEEIALLLLYPPADEKNFFEKWETKKDFFPNKISHELESYWANLKKLKDNLQNPKIKWEPLLGSATLYYSGWFFEFFITGLAHPPVRGGEYQELFEKYSQEKKPACGFAVDLSSLCGIR